MARQIGAPRLGVVVRHGVVASLGVGGAAMLATVVVVLLRCVDGKDGPLSALRSCLVFGAETALPCAVIMCPLAAWRLRRTVGMTLQERCASVAIWSCAVPFAWGMGLAAVAARGESFGLPMRGLMGIGLMAGAAAEAVWLFTLTPVFVHHCTARALRRDPFTGDARPRDGRDEREEDAEIGAAS